MAATLFVLLVSCLILTIYGLPVDVLISPPQVETSGNGAAPKGLNPQLIAGGFEGDMMFPDGADPARGVAIIGKRQWPNGVIPYDISAITNAQDQQKITNAMNTLMYAVATPIANSQSRTACVFFRPRQSSDKDYISIQYGSGCSANVGYTQGFQSKVTLQQNGCFYTGTIQHELMHVLGFFHEQSRPDRDNYLQINLENVRPNMVHNFEKYAWGSSVYNQGTSYDYKSVMHYETTAFSMNGKPTMVPRQAGATIGRAEMLSALDIAEVRHFYGCKA
ncbi:unnamed protein product [Adineta ricciae]|uniref:Metalloendopeptidase n=1 Tax=Adineta ricciae TaxID=249248 RepID=A0A815GVV3_ADIRI|nr:unnamed protein product [Adineta ricciae]CAF1343434.1 unnamed protein product [Adineta ricciae]